MEFDPFNKFLRENESIHAKRLSRVDWYISLLDSEPKHDLWPVIWPSRLQGQRTGYRITSRNNVSTSDANWKPKSWSSKKCPMSNLDIGRTKAKILGQLWTAIRYLPFFREKHAQVHAT